MFVLYFSTVKILATKADSHISAVATVLLTTKTFTVKYYEIGGAGEGIKREMGGGGGGAGGRERERGRGEREREGGEGKLEPMTSKQEDFKARGLTLGCAESTDTRHVLSVPCHYYTGTALVSILIIIRATTPPPPPPPPPPPQQKQTEIKWQEILHSCCSGAGIAQWLEHRTRD